MPSVLVLNSGSSSLKHQLVDVDRESVLARGGVDRIGGARSTLTHTGADGNTVEREVTVPDHAGALHLVTEAYAGCGPDLDSVDLVGVGHRVVHGGDHSRPTVVTEEVLQQIEELAVLAPLHNPPAVAGIRAARAQRPDVPHVAVFDTAFFADLPPEARSYAIDADVAAEHGLRRYGFHGTSHGYVAGRVAELLERPLDGLRQIVAHLGNGASISAVDGGRPVDTSMGLTPLEGLVMGTRSGDLDPAVLLTLGRAGWSTDELDRLLNSGSGLRGLSGVSDFRELLARVDAGDERAQLAHDIYVHRLVRYVGGYHALLGGAEVLTFTAGVGQHSARLRSAVLQRLRPLGFLLDRAANEAATGTEAQVVSAPDSPVTVAVVPTDEERAIAEQTVALLARSTS